MDISVLIPLLRENHVTRFEGLGFKIELSPPSPAGSAPAVAAAPASPPIAATAATPSPTPIPSSMEEAAKASGVGLPPDLRPDTMDVDKIAMWSASPDAADPQGEALPLTGDQPISE